MTAKLHYIFMFWLENKADSQFELVAETLVEKFVKWLQTKEQDWLEYYPAETVVRHFITGKPGLNSTFKESQLPSIMYYLKPVYIQHTFPNNIKSSML